MGAVIVTLESERTLSLPHEATSALGCAPVRVSLTLKDGAILLQPLQLRGIFSSDTGLVAELRQERRQDKR